MSISSVRVMLFGLVAIALLSVPAWCDPQQRQDFAAWNHFADQLKAQGQRVMAKMPARLRRDPAMRQEAERLLLGALVARSLDALAGDGDHPIFVPWANVLLTPNQPNDDTIYRKATITPGGIYELRGEMGSLRLLVMAQLKSPIEETGVIERGMGVLAYDDFAQLHHDAAGRFDVILSPVRPPGYLGDWWRLDPGATALWLRQVAYDWQHERDPRLSIERVDIPAGAPPQAPAADLDTRLGRLATYVGNTASYMVDHVERLRRDGYVNRLKVWEIQAGGKQLGQIGGLTGQFYYEGAFELAPDEALIVAARVPERCRYWSMLLTNDVYESIDWYDYPSSLNGAQARVDGDGIIRVVVSARDPGVPNWLDTQGLASGAIQGRWTGCSATPIPSVRKVKLDEVHAALPADTPRLTPAQRDAMVRDRRAAAQQRPLW